MAARPKPRIQAKPGTVDEYLATLSDDKRAALQKLRKAIRAAAPKAEECISYQIPSFKLNGMLVGFGAAANHCAPCTSEFDRGGRSQDRAEGL